MFLDKTENEKVNTVKEKMRQALIDNDIVRLESSVKEAQELNEGGILDKEVNYCKSKIELLNMQE
jgi:hypothetical protein